MCSTLASTEIHMWVRNLRRVVRTVLEILELLCAEHRASYDLRARGRRFCAGLGGDPAAVTQDKSPLPGPRLDWDQGKYNHVYSMVQVHWILGLCSFRVGPLLPCLPESCVTCMQVRRRHQHQRQNFASAELALFQIKRIIMRPFCNGVVMSFIWSITDTVLYQIHKDIREVGNTVEKVYWHLCWC